MHTPLPNLHLPRFGWAYGISFEDGIVNGARGQTGTALGAQTTTHTISGLASFTAPMIQSSVTLNANPISGDITVREHAEQELLAALGYL
jgi:hypothetical protein